MRSERHWEPPAARAAGVLGEEERSDAPVRYSRHRIVMNGLGQNVRFWVRRLRGALLPADEETIGQDARGAQLAIPTIGLLSLSEPVEPWKPAAPKAKIPPSDATSQ